MANYQLKEMDFAKRNAHPPSHSFFCFLFFTVILTRTKQLFDCRLNNVKPQKYFYNFTYFFHILGRNIRFPKIPKSTHMVNVYSGFSCKSRFDFTTTLYLWKPNSTFCFWDHEAIIRRE